MGLGQPGLDNAVAYRTTSQAFLRYSLFSTMFALGAAFVFFLVERGSVLPACRATMTTSAMICGAAAVAYCFITILSCERARLRQDAASPRRPLPKVRGLLAPID